MRLLKENKRFAEIAGIDKWHENGITGKGVRIVIFDKRFNTQSPGAQKIYHGKVRGVNGFDNDEISSHGSAVAHIIHQICPDADIYCMSATTENLLWCKDNDIDIINVSMKLFKREGFEDALNEFAATGGWMFSSAGNTDEDKNLGIPAGYENCVAVGAVHLQYPGQKKERIYRANYSSYTKEEKEYIWEMVEIMGFSGIYVMTPKYPDIDNKGNYHSFQFNGTSGASPFVAGMAGLYRQLCGKISLDEFRNFMYENAMDMEEEGYDRFTGHGLFKLPEAMRLIELTIGSNKYKVDGEEREMDTAPFVKDMRTFVPIRFVAEALGKKVSYTTKNGLTDKVYIES